MSIRDGSIREAAELRAASHEWTQQHAAELSRADLRGELSAAMAQTLDPSDVAVMVAIGLLGALPTGPVTLGPLAKYGPTTKSPSLVVLPPAVASVTGPEVKLAGVVTTALFPSGATDTTVAATPLNCTLVRPVRLAPLMVTEVPPGAAAGSKLVMAGEVMVRSVPLSVAVVSEATATWPVVVFFGTTAVTTESVTDAGTTSLPLSRTVVTPARFEPLIVIVEPIAADSGEMEEMMGAPGEKSSPLLIAP